MPLHDLAKQFKQSSKALKRIDGSISFKSTFYEFLQPITAILKDWKDRKGSKWLSILSTHASLKKEGMDEAINNLETQRLRLYQSGPALANDFMDLLGSSNFKAQSAHDETALSTCMSYTLSILLDRSRKITLSDEDARSLIQSSSTLPSSSWAQKTLFFSASHRPYPRRIDLLATFLSQYAHLPEAGTLLSKLARDQIISEPALFELCNRYTSPHRHDFHGPTQALFWTPVMRGGLTDPWLRSACLGLHLRYRNENQHDNEHQNLDHHQLPLSEDDFSFKPALEVALLLGSAQDTKLALLSLQKLSDPQEPLTSITGIPLAFIAAQSKLDVTEKLILLKEAGCDLNAFYQPDSSCLQAAYFLTLFKDQCQLFYNFFSADRGFKSQLALHAKQQDPSTPSALRESLLFSSNSHYAKDSLSSRHLGHFLLCHAHVDILSWLRSTGPLEASAVEALFSSESKDTPMPYFSKALLESFEAAHFRMNPNQITQWFFYLGYETFNQGMNHGLDNTFKVAPEHLDAFIFLYQRGHFQTEEGLSSFVKAATVGIEYRLRFAKLGLLFDLPFSEEQRACLETAISEQPILFESPWITDEALILFEAFKIRESLPALDSSQAPPKKAALRL